MSRTIRALLAGLTAVVVVGCGSDSPTTPTPTLVGLNDVLSQLSVNTLDGIAGARTLLGIPFALEEPSIDQSVCVYSATTQGFACPAQVAGGLTFTVTYYLLNAQGKAQTQPLDGGPTASVRVVADAKGTVTASGTSAIGASVAITDHSDLTMTGLLETTHVLNGTSTSHYDVTASGAVPVHSVLDLATTTTNVAISTATSTALWPLSGTVAADMNGVTSVGTLPALQTALHVMITFNGTSIPATVFTSNGVTVSCRLDLSGATAPTCS